MPCEFSLLASGCRVLSAYPATHTSASVASTGEWVTRVRCPPSPMHAQAWTSFLRKSTLSMATSKMNVRVRVLPPSPQDLASILEWFADGVKSCSKRIRYTRYQGMEQERSYSYTGHTSVFLFATVASTSEPGGRLLCFLFDFLSRWRCFFFFFFSDRVFFSDPVSSAVIAREQQSFLIVCQQLMRVTVTSSPYKFQCVMKRTIVK